MATGVAGLGFGPAFAGAFRAVSNRAPADQRAALVASVYVASYLAYSLPALAAGIAVTRFGLHDTANVYGVALIAWRCVALALSHRLRGSRVGRLRRAREALAGVGCAPRRRRGDARCVAEQIQ